MVNKGLRTEADFSGLKMSLRKRWKWPILIDSSSRNSIPGICGVELHNERLAFKLLEKGHIVHATTRNLGISDNKIYHYHLNLRSVFARRLTRLPSIPKNDAKIR
ncbi:hypothetical protein PVK06_037422 [Gossypium arboreum]|uniref:Uncharacterized protein n=1 Tax=Gossypium arboreum TaxID=29729 RepID=A0ABR0MX86_GOSAR|nr:hypothetical protein PVK06_037422 [Gossypium arboreum]